MRIRRFTARDMTEALRVVRETLGPEAVILEAKASAEGRGTRGGVTVMAAVDRHPETQPDRRPTFGAGEASGGRRPRGPGGPGNDSGDRNVAHARAATGRTPARSPRASGLVDEPIRLTRGAAGERATASGGGPASARTPAIGRGASQPWAKLRGAGRGPLGLIEETALEPADEAPGIAERSPAGLSPQEQEIKRLQSRVFYLNRLITSDHFSTIPIPLRELYLDLLDAEVDSNLSFAILRDLAQRTKADIVSGPQKGPLRERLLRVVPQGEAITAKPGRRVVLLVGAPGSGKSVVAASLAAQSLRLGRRPGLMSLDSFHPDGSTSLAHYARLLDIPFVSLLEPQDLARAEDVRLAGCDLLLIDTPGISRQEREAVTLVRGFQLAFAQPEVHAILDATSRVRDSADVLDLLRHFQLASLIFTKVDLTKSYGGILSLSLKTRTPVSHWGWGQRILQDLRTFDPETLVDLVLDGCATDWEDQDESRQGSTLKEAVR